MESFPKPLHLEFLDQRFDRRRFRLIAPFEYHFQTRNGPDCISVPVNYQSDFASVPRLFWLIFPPVGLYGKATVIHDYLCDHPEERTRHEADLIFRQAMIDLEVASWKIFCMYTAVSLRTTVLMGQQWLRKRLLMRRIRRRAL